MKKRSQKNQIKDLQAALDMMASRAYEKDGNYRNAEILGASLTSLFSETESALFQLRDAAEKMFRTLDRHKGVYAAAAARWRPSEADEITEKMARDLLKQVEKRRKARKKFVQK